jgi:hypothetical protein
MDAPPFSVLPFNSDNLFQSFCSARCSIDEVRQRESVDYLFRYLTDLGAKSIVVEDGYTDGDYLEDFASYYVRCFEQYERRCKRLHFSATEITLEQFERLILSTSIDERKAFAASYLGFVVARPLPNAIVGRTMLRTYESAGGRRNYLAVRDYPAQLFGLDLSVQTLPFQEQDSVLAACATVALWSAFHKTAHLFGTSAPRPALITRSANNVANQFRPIPSHGLSIQQMCHAIREVGLESELVTAGPNVPFVSLLYGHLHSGLPVVLVVDIEGRGRHAVTLTGYSLRNERVLGQEVASGAHAIPMIGLRIDEFYAHDDQIGPFARMTVKPPSIDSPVLFEGSWKDSDTGKTLTMTPVVAIVPVYNKIRVTFIDVQKWLTRLTRVLRLLLPEDAEFEWDLHLVTTNDLKRRIVSEVLPDRDRKRILFKQQPRFMWRALLVHGSTPLMELLVDATDMERSFPIHDGIWRHDDFRERLQILLGAEQLQELLSKHLTNRFLAFLKNSVS